jgi:hypothetical protein
MRSGPRVSIRIPAKLLDGQGEPVADVTVTDISPGGARLLVPPGSSIPEEVHLLIPNRGERRPCQVRWRLTGAVGVRFTDRRSAPRRPGVASRTLELEAAVARLEREKAALVRELAMHRAFSFREVEDAPPAAPAPGPAPASAKAAATARFVTPVHVRMAAAG